MEDRSILIVDDEKNIRLTMATALEPLGVHIESAVNGEEGLQKLRDRKFGLVFLDLKMPGMDGMTVLDRIRDEWPDVRVVIITAHGTVETAVEAMKLGAVDFIQKPFSPTEIRELAAQVLARETMTLVDAVDYPALIQLAKLRITDRKFTAAQETVRQAIAADPGQPEAYNLLGALLEIHGEWLEAQKFYRAALEIDPTFQSARANLERITSYRKFGGIDLGPDRRSASPEDADENGGASEK